MRIRDLRSIIVILFYLGLNAGILVVSFMQTGTEETFVKGSRDFSPDYTEIEKLDYFHLKNGLPQMSLTADSMKSKGEVYAEFQSPKGLYNYQQQKESLRYQGDLGVYKKKLNYLTLQGQVKISSEEAEYFADNFEYFFNQDLIRGNGHVKFVGEDLKSKDSVFIESQKMEAHPDKKQSVFTGSVKGFLARKKKYEGKVDFASDFLSVDGVSSYLHLDGQVLLKRGNYVVTSGKGDIYLENFNKSLKYFVLNDDVKLTEKLVTPQGVTERKAFAERLEGFGQEQKMILSGAPRVETGQDLIKGYRITIRENVDLVEVDDAMSDVQVKREDKKK
jgi:lipopolysaccharide export system protein LptA